MFRISCLKPNLINQNSNVRPESALHNILAGHERNVLSQYRVELISYHDNPVIRDFWGQGLIIPQMTKTSISGKKFKRELNRLFSLMSFQQSHFKALHTYWG